MAVEVLDKLEKALSCGLKPDEDPITKAGIPLYYGEKYKFVLDSVTNTCVVGNTGCGKTTGLIIPALHEVINKGESAIVMDPKGDILDHIRSEIDKTKYNLYQFDLIEPSSSPSGYNPIKPIFDLYRSDKITDRDYAFQMLDDIWSSVYSVEPNTDPFWCHSAKNVAKSVTLSLFRFAENCEINLFSVSKMIIDLENKISSSTEGKLLYETLPDDSIEKTFLAGFAGAANETRMSTYSVACHEVYPFFESEGTKRFLCRNDFDLLKIDFNKPTLIFISLPVESDRSDKLASIIISQLIRHLFHTATMRGGKLPLPWTMFLDEVGILSNAFPSLDRYMSTGRSHNIKTILALQSLEQFKAVFGDHKAAGIWGTINCVIGFSSNDFITMEELSLRTGKTVFSLPNASFLQPNIAANALQDMPVGKAIAIWGNQKWLVNLRPYPDNNKVSDRLTRKPVDVDVHCFDMYSLLEDALKVKMEKNIANMPRLFPKYRPKDDDDIFDDDEYDDDIDTASSDDEADEPEELTSGTEEISEELKALIDDKSFSDLSDIFSCANTGFYWLNLAARIKKQTGSSLDIIKDTLKSVSIRQLINNRERSFSHHLRISNIGDSFFIDSLTGELSKGFPEICEYAWCAILSNLPYTVSFRTKAQLDTIKKVIEHGGGKSEVIDDDLYYEAYDAHHCDSDDFYTESALTSIRHNHNMRHAFKNHVTITTCQHIAETAREIASICPEWDAFTLRSIMRDRLPFTLNCETKAQADKIVSIICKHNNGDAVLHI